MIEFSDHARRAMQDDEISEEEVEACLKYGELEIKQRVNGELRYGKQIELKNKIIMVIYTIRGNIDRIITAYIIRRKKWQNQ
jgi:hypothetical protein